MSSSVRTAARPYPTHPDPATLCAWAGSACLALLPLWHLLHAGSRASLYAEGVATFTRLALIGAAMLWAAGGAGLHARLRTSLAIIGITGLVSAGMAASYALTRNAGLASPPAAFYTVWSFGSFVLLLVAILRMPMSPPLGRPEGWTFPLDLVLSVGGWMAVTGSLLLTAPPPGGGGAGPPVPYAYVATSALVLAALNLLTLRGRALPSERAFLLFLLGQGSHFVSLFLRVLDRGHGSLVFWADAAYHVGAIPILWSAWAMRRDAVPARGGEPTVHWIREFNPFALVMPLVTAVALLHALRAGPQAAVWPLAVTAAGVGILLVARLGITIVESRRRLRAEAAAEARRQAERLEALRRVAGGVAHSFNNSLTVILGEASEAEAPLADSETRNAIRRIRQAGEQSARLTRHLLWFTGLQFQRRERIDLDTLLTSLEPEIRHRAGPTVEVAVEACTRGAVVEGDRGQLRHVLIELVRNAVNAMPAGGRLRMRADRTTVDARDGAAPARPLRIVVGDTGQGIAPEHLPHVFEPFFSSRGMADAPGLGLAITQGVVLSHGGVVHVESQPDRGTEVCILLPEA